MAASSDVLVKRITGEFMEMSLCSICTEMFTNPRLLTCRHTFCLHCLQTYAREKRSGESVACPICRQESVIPCGGLVNLERNRDMEKLAETSRRVESRLKEGEYHCDEHADKPVMLFCQTCDCLVCSACIVGKHAGHRYQETDGAADELMSQLETKLGISVSDCVTKLQARQMQMNGMRWAHQLKSDEIRLKILKHHKDVEAMLVADRESLLSELQTTTRELEQLKDQTSDFVEKLKLLSNVTEVKNRPLEVISQCSDLLQLPIEDVVNNMDMDETSLSFEPNFKLFKLQNKAVNLLGTLSDVSSEKQGQKLKGHLIVKKGHTSNPGNYSSISLMCISFCRVMKHIIVILELLNYLYQHGLISKCQHGLLQKHSTCRNLLESVLVCCTE